MDCAGAVIYLVADFGYLDGFPKESTEDWQEEWFYLPDVPLEDPPRAGLLTPFTGARRAGFKQTQKR